MLRVVPTKPILALALLFGGREALANGTGSSAPTIAGHEALHLAFRFASAIESDPKDRARSQQVVIEDLAAIGAVDDAIAYANQVEGWRRGILHAELARDLAKAGRLEAARSLLSKAEEERTQVKGWENPRIAAHIAEALAALGETERVGEISRVLEADDSRQYVGRAAAAQAVGHATQGDFAAAMAKLAALEAETDIDAAWWRTSGYLELSRSKSATDAQRKAALAAARRSVDTIPGWKQAEALESIAERFHELRDGKAAREALQAAETVSLATPKTAPERAAMLATLARSFGKIGAGSRSRELLRDAESAVPNALNIEQPGLHSFVAAAYLELGDDADAWRAYDRAIRTAESLVNARPRALAAVEICRSVGLQRVELRSQAKVRLEALLVGLKAPW